MALHREARDRATAVEGLGDELALVAAVRQDDGDAFVTIFQRYFAPLRAFAQRLVGSREAAEDVVHDVFLGVWERRKDWFVTTSVRHYLYGATRNRALKALRSDRDVSLDAVLAHVDLKADPHGESCAAEVRTALAHTIERLPRRCRQVCVLRWQYEMTYPEIAHLLGVSVKAVEAQVSAALKVFRKRLVRFAGQ